jgi:hypothetical protein
MSEHMPTRKIVHSASVVIVFFLLLILVCNRAEAVSVNGYAEFDYSAFDTNSTDKTAGTNVKTKSTEFTQNYNLNLILDPFPNVLVTSGVLLTNEYAKVTTGDVSSNASVFTVRPFVDVRLHDPLNIYYAEAGYSIQKSTTHGTNSPRQTLYDEIYNASAGWTPAAFPSLPLPTFGLQATQSNIYDQNRQFADTTTDTVQFNTAYLPVRQLDLTYNAIYTKATDHLSQLETEVFNQSVDVNYTDNFLQNRILFSAGYIISFIDTRTSQQGQGTVSFPLFPFAGLSNVTDIPTTDTLISNPALIDGNVTVSTNINIGSAPTLAGDTKFREMGIDFVVTTEVNNLLIWVNQQLAADIADSFSWDIYTSADNATWTFFQTVSPAPFGPFQNRFSLSFNNVQTRYIKVVTRPLALTVPGATNPNNQNILVTEMQAFITKPAQSASGETSQVNQLYNANISAQIFEGVYVVTQYNAAEGSFTANGVERTSHVYTLSNSVNLTRHLNIGPGITASARVSRDDNTNSAGPSTGAYNYNATLAAVPLRTLRSSLVYGGTTADDGSKSDSLTLNATADLYRGISVNTSIGASTSLSNTGVRTDGQNFLASAGVTPRRDLSFSLTYQTNNGRSYGGNQLLGTESTLEQWNISTTYRPIESVYLTAAIGEVRRTGAQNVTSQTYGLNWSPLFSGDLQLSFIFTDGYQSYLNQRQRTYGPSLTWRLIPSATLDISYFDTESSSQLVETSTKNLFVSYKMYL